MILSKQIDAIKFFFQQNLKYQTFDKEYNYNFTEDVNEFINEYSKIIPNEINTNQKIDLLNDIAFDDRVKNFEKVKKSINGSRHIDIQLNEIIKKNLNEIYNDGITNINFLELNDSQIKDFLNELDTKKRYEGHTIAHSVGKPINKNQMKDDSFYTFESQDIIKIRQVTRILNDTNLKAFILNYFGCIPTLNSLNVYITTKTSIEKGVQLFHRDNEDFKTLNIFFLLQNSKKNDGGHGFIKSSHNPYCLKKNISNEQFSKIKEIALQNYNLNINSINDICNMPKDGYGYEKIYDVLSNLHIDVHGKAGKIFAEDNFGLHKSIKTSDQRIIFWLSFSLTSVGTTRYCISHKILRKFIPKRVYFSDIKNSLDDDFFNKYVYRYYINFLK